LLLWCVHLLGFYAGVGAEQVVSDVPLGPMSSVKRKRALNLIIIDFSRLFAPNWGIVVNEL
jgi:hypothetical protein